MRSLLLVGLAVVLAGAGSLRGAPPPYFTSQIDVCNVFGAIYVEQDPYLADFRVFVEEESEFRAKIVVFKESNQLFADKPGFWFFTKQRGFANYRIAFVKDRYAADFIIYYTDKEIYARCQP